MRCGKPLAGFRYGLKPTRLTGAVTSIMEARVQASTRQELRPYGGRYPPRPIVRIDRWRLNSRDW